MPYITEKWLGGTFTNFSNVSKLVKQLKDFRDKFQTGEIKKYSKKERSVYQAKLSKLEKLVAGIENMGKVPAALFLIDVKEEKTAVKEARKKGVPIVAVVDTNVNPELIDYPIPGNDDATKSIELFAGVICEAVKEGQAAMKSDEPVQVEEKPVSTKEKKSEEVAVKDNVSKNIKEIEEDEKEVTSDKALKS